MNNQSSKDGISYTSNDELAELTDKDTTVEVIGFVDEINPSIVVGAKKDIHLFKFTLTNGDKRLPIIIWGQDLIRKYEPEISMNKIIHITRGESKLANPNYIKDTERTLKFELTILKKSTVEYLGNHSSGSNQTTLKPQKVDFESIGAAKGLIVIKGHLKLQFDLISLRGMASYGEGVITDGISKVIIHIANYTALSIDLGTCIEVTGQLKNSSGPTCIFCTDSSSITSIPEVPAMDKVTMRKGVRSPKRIRPDNA